jgi:F0F1-type ATP synthase gamma subunit
MEEDVSKDLAEFALANAIFTALVEGHAAEISARRTAMENASNVCHLILSFCRAIPETILMYRTPTT